MAACRHKVGRELVYRLEFCHMSLTKPERGQGVELVCKGVVRMIVEFKLEYGLKDFVGLKDCEQVKDSIDHGFQWGWRAVGGYGTRRTHVKSER